MKLIWTERLLKIGKRKSNKGEELNKNYLKEFLVVKKQKVVLGYGVPIEE